MPFARVRAPELRGRGWLNTGGTAYSISDLRGRFVLLDFWTSCCINCLHVIEELRVVQEKYAEELVVIGVHSPKFEHEAAADALAAAVERQRVDHAVLDDPELITWQAYTARAWPTMVLIDPEGYIVAQHTGEGHASAIDRTLAELVEVHRDRGTLTPAGSPYVAPLVESGDLRFPADVVPLVDGAVLVADAGHDQLVVVGVDGRVRRRIAGFREPNGLCLLPPAVAARVGYDVVVADTGHHRLCGVALRNGEVTALTGASDGLSSPWSVPWWRHRVWVAVAGTHQLATLDPRTGLVEVTGGTAHEGLLDGPLVDAWFAQPSGLAAGGDQLWLVDAETSALRWVQDGQDGLSVHTAVGEGLFDFGFRDGSAGKALLQHPLGVTVLPEGRIAVCDTYNGAVRRFDPATGLVDTLATDLVEPAAAYLDGTDLVVVESGAHRLTRVPLGAAPIRVDGLVHTTGRPVAEVTAELDLVVQFVSPPGQHLDERLDPGTQLVVEATPPMLLKDGAGRDAGLTRRLLLDPMVGDGVLHIAARAASCDVVTPGAPTLGAACHVHQQDWGVPVRVTADGAHELTLRLGAQPAQLAAEQQEPGDGDHRQTDEDVEDLPGPRARQQG